LAYIFVINYPISKQTAITQNDHQKLFATMKNPTRIFYGGLFISYVIIYTLMALIG